MTSPPRPDRPQAVVLSAATGTRLRAYARRLRDHLAELAVDPGAPGLADVAYTLQTGRVAMPHRLAVTATDLDGAARGLDAYLAGRPHPGVATGVVGAGPDGPDDRAGPAAPDDPVHSGDGPASGPEAVAAWLAGQDVVWQGYWPTPARRVPLPTYPWDDGEPEATDPAGGRAPAGSAAAPEPAAVAAARRYLRDLYAEISGIPVGDLHPHAPLERYGLSSFLVTRLNARLERDLGETDRTLFFAHPDLAGIAGTLAHRHPSRWDTTGTDAAGATPATGTRPASPDAATAGTDGGAVAVIGMAGRYPGAPDLDRLWEVLAQGRDCVRQVPPERVRDGWPVAEMWGGFLDDMDRFDPLLFHITPRDAELMDPQERLFLEVTWEALEDAGYTRQRLRDRHRSRVAVYAGVMHNEYPYFGVEQSRPGVRQDSGATLGGVANRVSFFLDLHGPSMSVDTMCSSSLTAIHLALRSLRGGEVEVAIAGAVNLSLHPNKFVQQARMRLIASDRRCRSFGEGGDGFVPAEGAGVLVLKPLRRALADGDRVHAVIRGSCTVHAGRTNGYLVPNPAAQGEMISQALRDAGVAPESIGYLEAHGAGTALGDPVEINGMLRVFGDAGLPPGAIPIGSIKSNFGHVEAAAGIAGLTKVILQMRHGMLVPSLHTGRVNPDIDWDRVPFQVQRELAPWPSVGGPRRAGVSSFGAGGSIAHVVVEEAPGLPPGEPAAARSGPWLAALSAYDARRLRELVARMVDSLRRPPGPDHPLADIAYTLQVGREPLRERLAVVVAGHDELRERLEGFLAGAGDPRLHQGRAPGTPDPEAPVLPVTGGAVDPHALARAWVTGAVVDWQRLYPPERLPRIVSLPHYPFARMRCWLPEAAAGPPAVPAPAVATPPGGEVPLYQRVWTPAPALPAGRAPERPVLCLYGDHSEPVARRLADRLGGSRVLLVREGGDLADPAGGYVTEPDAVALAARVLDEHPDLDGCLDLADLDRPPAAQGLWRSRLALFQHLVRHRVHGGLRLLQVVRGLQHVGQAGADPPGPPAPDRVAGFVRVLGAEYRKLRATVLDTDLSVGHPDALVDEILAEWPVSDPYGEICRRAGQRYRPDVRAVAAPHQPLRLDPDAAYLVTGGTRGLGALVARLLVERGARRLALCGRRPPPDDSDGGADRDTRAATVRGLRDLGAGVLVYGGALTDREKLGGFLDRVRREWGPLAGIVHCAGRSSAAQDGFVYQDLDDAQAVLEPKVDGLEALTELTAGDGPDFVVLFSSVCAAVPSLAAGVTDYAAANGCLDFAAVHQARHGRRYWSINWPQWSDSGGGRGRDNPCRPVGLATVDDRTGLRVLERVLAMPGGGCVLPAPPLAGEVDLAALTRLRSGDTATAPEQTAPGQTAPDPPAPDPPAPEQTDGEPAPWLVDIFARALHVPAADLDPTATFGDLGVESIMLGELLRAIENHLGTSLEPAVLLDHPTLRQLGSHLGGHPPARTGDEVPAGGGGHVPVAADRAPARPVTASTDHRVAVIGMACRFPGAAGTDALWAILRDGGSAVTEVPAGRWDVDRHYRPEPGLGYSISRWGGFVDGIEDFDPEYFGLTEDDATCLDPAIRLFLEETAGCLHHAGYGDDDVAGRDVGVFVGARMSEYGRRVGVRPGVLRSDQNFIAAHVAHHFDLRGPNLVVDSACSSSLVAVQLAIRSLLAGESTMALAGGVEVLLDEQVYVDLSAARALSPSGRCAAFDRDADGFVPGEGCGVVLLKPLGAALADGDRVHAVIEAVAVNNDGQTMGMTTPNPAAQARVVRRALESAGRRPHEIGMVEAHGTGTLIGDPIELRALTDVFATTTGRTGWCAIGSVKSNLGHLLSAAGAAGLLKVVLSLVHGEIPPTLHCETPNPRFDFAGSPFFPNTALRPWPATTRVAGLSSFGLGGTNAHLVASNAGAHLPDGYQPRRQPLPAPGFRRRRLWLDHPDGDRSPAEEPRPVASILDLELTLDGSPVGELAERR